MPQTAKSPVMNDAQFAGLSRLIYDRAGIHFPESKRYVLEARLGRRLQELGLDNYGQYLTLLSAGPYQRDELQELFNKVTINETSFFRNQPQLDAFETVVLPELLEARAGVRRLRVWSAACSSGEEAYTLAILLDRALGVRKAGWHVEVLGTDISELVLATAQAGVYTDYALRTTPAAVRQRCFTREGALWRVNDDVRSMVSFQAHNLKDRAAARRFGRFDAVFCRNAFIYFDDAMKRLVAGTFGAALEADGTLFLGHSETLRGLGTAFEPRPIPHGFCYRRGPGEGPGAANNDTTDQ